MEMTSLARQIPVTRAMRLRVEFSPPHTARVRAPLAPNHNDKGTAFAGAIYSALVLAPWSLLTELLRRDGIEADVMVYRSSVKFLQAIREDFVAECSAPSARRKLTTLPARVTLASGIRGADGKPAAEFRGSFYIRKRRSK
jgi:thioesterase domain-containing protein